MAWWIGHFSGECKTPCSSSKKFLELVPDSTCWRSLAQTGLARRISPSHARCSGRPSCANSWIVQAFLPSGPHDTERVCFCFLKSTNKRSSQSAKLYVFPSCPPKNTCGVVHFGETSQSVPIHLAHEPLVCTFTSLVRSASASPLASCQHQALEQPFLARHSPYCQRAGGRLAAQAAAERRCPFQRQGCANRDPNPTCMSPWDK